MEVNLSRLQVMGFVLSVWHSIRPVTMTIDCPMGRWQRRLQHWPPKDIRWNIATVDTTNRTFAEDELANQGQGLCPAGWQATGNGCSMGRSMYGVVCQGLALVTMWTDISAKDVALERLIDAADEFAADAIVSLCYLPCGDDDANGDAFDDSPAFVFWPRFSVFGAVDICSRDALSYEALWLRKETTEKCAKMKELQKSAYSINLNLIEMN